MKTRLLKAPFATLGRAARRGFTLIELLAVILIISILVAALTPMVNDAIERAEVNACQANLREMYKGMIMYKTQYNEAPKGSGVKFFASLISRRTMENTKTNAERLTCPGVEKSALTIGAVAMGGVVDRSRPGRRGRTPHTPAARREGVPAAQVPRQGGRSR